MTNGFHVCEGNGSSSTEKEHFKVLPMKTHHGYGYDITQVEYFRHYTHTCITHDLNTIGLPAPMMIPNGSSSTEKEHFKVLPMKTHDTMGMGMV
jgi:hypothetical protein